MCGPEPFSVLSGKHTQGYIIDINNGKVLSTFNGDGDGFQNPHDVAVSKDGDTVYEVELKPFKVFKLTDGERGGVKEGTYKPKPLLSKVFDWLG